MAHIYRLPGAYPANEASRLLNQGLLIVLAFVMVTSGIAGYALRATGTWFGLLVVLIALAVAVIGERVLTRRLDRLTADRRKHLRGADGELLVAWILEQLPQEWHVFHGLVLTERKDLDHVVVGPGGLYYIATKNWRGLFSRGNAGELLYNNEPTGIAQQVLRDTMVFRERLCSLLGTEVYVNAVLAVPFAWVQISGAYRNVWLLHQHDLLKSLESAPKRFNKAQVAACVNALNLLAESGLEVRQAAARAQFGAR